MRTVFLDNFEVSYGSGSSVIDTLQNMQVSIGDSNVDLYLPTKVGSRWNQMHSSLMVDIYTQLSQSCSPLIFYVGVAAIVYLVFFKFGERKSYSRILLTDANV